MLLNVVFSFLLLARLNANEFELIVHKHIQVVLFLDGYLGFNRFGSPPRGLLPARGHIRGPSGRCDLWHAGRAVAPGLVRAP